MSSFVRVGREGINGTVGEQRQSQGEGFALGLPGAYEDMPWEGDVVAKVNQKRSPST